MGPGFADHPVQDDLGPLILRISWSGPSRFGGPWLFDRELHAFRVIDHFKTGGAGGFSVTDSLASVHFANRAFFLIF